MRNTRFMPTIDQAEGRSLMSALSGIIGLVGSTAIIENASIAPPTQPGDPEQFLDMKNLYGPGNLGPPPPNVLDFNDPTQYPPLDLPSIPGGPVVPA